MKDSKKLQNEKNSKLILVVDKKSFYIKLSNPFDFHLSVNSKRMQKKPETKTEISKKFLKNTCEKGQNCEHLHAVPLILDPNSNKAIPLSGFKLKEVQDTAFSLLLSQSKSGLYPIYEKFEGNLISHKKSNHPKAQGKEIKELLEEDREIIKKLSLESQLIVSLLQNLERRLELRFEKRFEEMNQKIDKRFEEINQKIGFNSEEILRSKVKNLKGEDHSKGKTVRSLSDLMDIMFGYGNNEKKRTHLEKVKSFLHMNRKNLRLVILNDYLKTQKCTIDFQYLSEVQIFLSINQKSEMSQALLLLFQDVKTSFNELSWLLLLLAFFKVNIKDSFESSIRSAIEFDCKGTHEVFRKDQRDSMTICEIKTIVMEEQMRKIVEQAKERISVLFGLYWIIGSDEKNNTIPSFFMNVLCHQLSKSDVENVIQENINSGFPLSISFEFL